MSTTKQRIVANSASGLAERVVNLLVQVWLYQYLVKRISPEEYSLYPVVTALLIFVPPLMAVLVSGLSRNTVEAHARNDEQLVTEITSTMCPVLLAAALTTVLVALIVARYLAAILNIGPQFLFEARLMVLLLFGSVALRLALAPFSVGLYVRQKFVVLNTLNILSTAIRITLLFMLLLGAGPRVIWVAVAAVAADAPVALGLAILSIRALPALKFRFDSIRWEMLSNLLAFGIWNMITSIGVLIRKSSDVLILNLFATPVDVNAFHLASLTDNQIDSALDKLAEPMAPQMVALHTSSGKTALQSVYIRGGRYCLWAALFVATPLIAFRQQLWSHYLGSRFEVYASVPTVMVLLLARYWMECPVSFLGMAAYAMKSVRTMSLMVIAYSLTNVVITVYLVHFLHAGAIGSALGTLISVVLWVPLVLWKFGLKLLGLPFGEWFKATVLRGILPSAVAGLVAWGWRFWMRPETIPELLVAILLVASVYVFSILLLCLDEDEHVEVKRLFERFCSPRTYKAFISWSQS